MDNLNRSKLNDTHSNRLFTFLYLHAESFDYHVRVSESFNAHVATLVALYERKARKQTSIFRLAACVSKAPLGNIRLREEIYQSRRGVAQ